MFANSEENSLRMINRNELFTTLDLMYDELSTHYDSSAAFDRFCQVLKQHHGVTNDADEIITIWKLSRGLTERDNNLLPFSLYFRQKIEENLSNCFVQLSPDTLPMAVFREFLIDRNIIFELIEVEWSEFRESDTEKIILKVVLCGYLGGYTFYVKETESLKILRCRNASGSWYGYRSDMHAWMHFFQVAQQHVECRRLK